jgi:hypothetical protein
MRLTFSAKILSLMVITVLVVGGAIFTFTSYFLSGRFDEQAQQLVDTLAANVQSEVGQLNAKAMEASIFIASRPDVIEGMKKKDSPSLQRLAKEIMTKNRLGVITIADKDGKVIARGHDDKVGDSVVSQLNVRKALAGETSVGMEEGSVVKFSIRAGCPVKAEDQIIGSITVGHDLAANNSFVDDMKKKLGVECTIFQNDTRISTTIVKDGKRAIGTKMDNPAVIETVLKKGQRFEGKNVILGKDYRTIYWPILAADGKANGMLFLGKDREEINNAFKTIMWTILLSVLVVGSLMILAGFFVVRSTIHPVMRNVNRLNADAVEVADASAQVAAASQSLSEGASQQASSLEETSSSLEEMASMTKQNADNANQANSLMAGTAGVAEEADRAMQDLTNSMNEISTASAETAKIIKTIDEIAFQTNLLALNAAVEAARAGEAGAGFAVVASEVRNLAVRSAEAAKHTATLIEDTVRKVNDGLGLVKRTNEAFTRVTAGSRKIGDLVTEIAAASQEQSQGIDQVNKAVAEMDKVTQQTAASAEQSASAAGEMKGRAGQMKEVVHELTTLITGRQSGGSSAKKRSTRADRKESPASVVAVSPLGTPSKVAKQAIVPGREVKPEEVIPLDKESFKDF